MILKDKKCIDIKFNLTMLFINLFHFEIQLKFSADRERGNDMIDGYTYTYIQIDRKITTEGEKERVREKMKVESILYC